MKGSRRNVLAGATSTAVVAMAGSVPALWSPSRAQQSEMPPDLIVHNAKVTTLQSSRPEAQAFAARGEKSPQLAATPRLWASVPPVRGSSMQEDGALSQASTTIICIWYAERCSTILSFAGMAWPP